MSSFLDPLILEDIGDRTFRLVNSFRFHIGGDESQEIITVPVGFITDFASIPQIFWNILPPFGPYGKAAVIHDALYQNHGFGKYERKRCDEILLEGMEALGVLWTTRHVIYAGVRLGGWWAWSHTKTQRNIKIIERSDVPPNEVSGAPKPVSRGEVKS